MRVYELRIFISLFMALLVAGCASTTNVTDDPRYQGGFKKGQVYRAKRPLSLTIDNYVKGFGAGNTEAVRRGILKRGSQNAYKGIIERGERLQIVKIEYHNVPGQYMAVRPYAKVLDGRFKGETVLIYDITKYMTGAWTPDHKVELRTANSEFLQKASQ